MDKADFTAFCEGLPSSSTSVGILAYEDEKSIVVLQSIGENTVADAVRINRSSVVKIEEIGELQDIQLAS